MTDELKNRIAARAKTDTDFKAALDKDPVTALTSAFGDELSLDDLDAISAGSISWSAGTSE